MILYTILFAITILITYCNLFFGTILAGIAPEELKKGKKYFYIMQKIILEIIIFLFTYTIIHQILSKTSTLIFTSIITIAFLKIKIGYQIIYGALPILSIPFFNDTKLIIILSLYALLGLIIGSYETEQFVNKKNDRILTKKYKYRMKKILKKTNVFFITYILSMIIVIIKINL